MRGDPQRKGGKFLENDGESVLRKTNQKKSKQPRVQTGRR